MKIKLYKQFIKIKNKDGQLEKMPILAPIQKADFIHFEKLPEKIILNANVTSSKGRVLKYHNQFFALLFFAFNNLPERYDFATRELFRKWLFLEIEFVDIIKIDGVICKFVKSQSFEKLDQDDFMRQVYNPSIEKLCKILNMDRSELIAASKETSYSKSLHQNE